MRDDVTSLMSGFTSLQSTVQQIATDQRAFSEGFSKKLEERSKINVPALGLGAMLLIAAVPIVTNYTSSTVVTATTPLVAAKESAAKSIDQLTGIVSTLQQTATANAASAIASTTDRAQLNENVRSLESNLSKEIADRRSILAEVNVKLREIETQICASKEIANLMHANDLRKTAFLWHKVTGDVLPTDNAYYPPCHGGPPDGNHGG
jgi:transcriptional regulator of met regulon